MSVNNIHLLEYSIPRPSCTASSQKMSSADISETESGIIDPLLFLAIMVAKALSISDLATLSSFLFHLAFQSSFNQLNFTTKPEHDTLMHSFPQSRILFLHRNMIHCSLLNYLFTRFGLPFPKTSHCWPTLHSAPWCHGLPLREPHWQQWRHCQLLLWPV